MEVQQKTHSSTKSSNTSGATLNGAPLNQATPKRLTAEGIKQILHDLKPGTQSLNLNHKIFSYNGAKALAQNTTLTDLNLSSNNIGDEVAVYFGKNTTLTALNLSNNKLGYKGAEEFAKNTTLTALNLSKNFIKNAPPAETLILEREIKNASGVTVGGEFRMNNHPKLNGVEKLAQNTTLLSLNLQDNKIGNQGAIALAKNTTLTSLNLRGNDIDDTGASDLANNTTLTKLNLRANPVGYQGAYAIADYNKTLRKLDMRDTKIGDTGECALKGISARSSKSKNKPQIHDPAERAIIGPPSFQVLKLNNDSDPDKLLIVMVGST